MSKKKEKSGALALAIPDETIATMEAQTKDVTGGMMAIGRMVPRTEEDNARIVDMSRKVQTVAKAMKAAKTSVKKPLREANRAVDIIFAPMEEALAKARDICDDKMFVYREYVEEEAEKERIKLDKEAERRKKIIDAAAQKKLDKATTKEERKEINRVTRGKHAAVDDVIEARQDAVEDTPERQEGVSVIEDVDFEVIDAQAVPEFVEFSGQEVQLFERVWKIANIKKLGKYDIKVPGVKFSKTHRTSVKGL